MSWSYRTGSPSPAHLSLGQRHWLTAQQPGGTKKTWRFSPTFLTSFRTIKRGAPTVWLLLHHLPLLLCLFSDSLLLLQRGRAAWQDCTIPPPQGGSCCWGRRSGFLFAASRFLPPLLVFRQWAGLRWRRSFRGRWGVFSGGEQHFETQLIRAVVFCHRGRGNVFLTRGNRETSAWITDGYLTKRRSAEGICLAFHENLEKMWEPLARW